jgi:hypothetical protein
MAISLDISRRQSFYDFSTTGQIVQSAFYCRLEMVLIKLQLKLLLKYIFGVHLNENNQK